MRKAVFTGVLALFLFGTNSELFLLLLEARIFVLKTALVVSAVFIVSGALGMSIKSLGSAFVAFLKKGRNIVGLTTIVLPLALFTYCIISYLGVSPGADIKEINDYNKTALQINLDTANSLASLTIGLAGGLWVLLLTTDKLPKVRSVDLVPFIGGSLSLLFSYVCYRMGLSQYVKMLFEAETIDLEAGFIRYWPTWQLTFFGFGFLVSVLALYDLYARGTK